MANCQISLRRGGRVREGVYKYTVYPFHSVVDLSGIL